MCPLLSSPSTSDQRSSTSSISSSSTSDVWSRSTYKDSFHVAIIGSGIAGTCLAIGLRKCPNVTVSIYEAAGQLSTVGAGLALGPNASRALGLIDPLLGKAYTENATNNMWPEHRNTWFQFVWGMQGRDEASLVASPQNQTGQSTIHRAKFLDILLSLLPKDTVFLGKRLVKIIDQAHQSEGHCSDLEDENWQRGAHNDGVVTLHFADGTSAQADCVIGADGVKSSVREYVLPGAEYTARFTGKVAYRGLVPIAKAESLLGTEYAQNAYNWIGWHGNVVTYPTDSGRMMNIVATSTRRWGDGVEYSDGKVADHPRWPYEEWVVKKPYPEIAAEFEDWGEVVRKIVSLLDASSTSSWSVWDHPSAPTYVKGKIALLGDSAHAMTPYQGQGAAMAIEDALVLAELLAEVQFTEDIGQALTVYDKVRRPRAEKVSSTSKEMGRLYQCDLDTFGADTKAIGEELERRMQWIWDIDLEALVRQSVATFRKNVEMRPSEVYGEFC